MTHPELPHNLDAEKATIGSCLLNRDAIISIADWLKPEHYSLERHALIYAAMLACYERRTPPDTRLVSEELRARGRLDMVGGVPYLSELVDLVPTSYHVEYYARIVWQLARKRRLIATGGKIAALGYDEGLEADEAEEKAQALLTEALTANERTDGFMPIGEGIVGELEAMQGGASPAIPTHYRDLDAILAGGLRRQELTVLAALSSSGKTAFALGLAYQVARWAAEHGQVVLVAEMEMSRQALRQRLGAMHGGIDLQRLRANALGDDEAAIAQVVDAYGAVCQWPLLVDDSFDQTTTQIRTRALRVRAEAGPIALLVVDYLQLLGDTARRGGTREQDVSAMSRGLKRLARELDCPVVALSQLSRAVEQREDKRPRMSDLRESGSIGNDADNVIGLYREEMFDAETDKKGTAELIVIKQRNGPIGVVPMRWDAATTSFRDLSYREMPGY